MNESAALIMRRHWQSPRLIVYWTKVQSLDHDPILKPKTTQKSQLRQAVMSAPRIAERPIGETWHSQPAEVVLAKLGSTPKGLSAQEAARRLAANGPNELKEARPVSPLQIFFGQFKNLIVWILIVAGLVS